MTRHRVYDCDPLVLSNTFSKANDRSYILTNIHVTEKQEILLAAKTSHLFPSNVMNLITTDFKPFLVMLKEVEGAASLLVTFFSSFNFRREKKFISLIIVLTF